MNIRKLRFPILIGIGVIGAGALVYLPHSGINSQHTQGAIGQRDVYRNGEVKAADVNATPGNAPVAIQAILETKEFQTLAKNQAFQSLLANQSFQQLSRNTELFHMLTNPAFLSMAQNIHFLNVMQNGSMHQLIALLLKQNSAADGSHADALMSADAQALSQNAQFQSLVHSSQFQSLVSNQSNRQALVHMLTMQSFAALAQNASFQNLMMNSSFQSAMASGAAANLSSQLVRQ